MPTSATTTTKSSSIVTEEAEAKTEKPSASIKFRLSSVSCSCFLTALKQHITTWRQKLTSSKSSSSKRKKRKGTTSPTPPTQPQEEKLNQCQYCHNLHSGKWFRKLTRKEFSSTKTSSNSNSSNVNNSFVQRTNVYCNTELQQISTNISIGRQFSTTTCGGDLKGPSRRYGRKVEIVANLLSLNLIRRSDPASEDYTVTQQRRGSVDSGFLSIDSSISSLSQNEEEFSNSTQDLLKFSEIPTNSVLTQTTADKMTITELTFLEIRDENPELDAEIRGILTARAQEGATISEIKEDYRKLTGLIFPVHERITDFLLSIPHVTAYCTETGLRIFNVRPMEKTKHVHDMVVHQKPAQEPMIKSYKTNYRQNYRERQRNTNYYPNSWRHNSSFRNRKMQEEKHYQYQQQQLEQQRDQAYPVEERQNPQVLICNEKNIQLQSTEDFIEHNCCYNDNCNYLLNRICSGPNIVEPIVNPLPLQAIEPPSTMYAWDDQQQETVYGEKDSLPPAGGLNKLNANPTCYDNNLDHLNSLFNKGNTNNMLSRPRRPSPPKGLMPPPSRSRSPTVRSYSTNDSMFTDSDYEAHLLDFLLLGDDFLLFMARMELRCKFKKNQKVLQSGLCVSGQTINAAIRRISNSNANGRSVIVNIGSVNILQCRQLIQIEHEYRELILTMLRKGIKPILTTLAPLANYTHNNEVKVTLERYNEFIKREAKRLDLVVIDIWKCLVNAKGHVLFDCYQSEPRVVTGAKEPYLFWNKIGRQRVLQLIESHLEY